MSESVKKPDWQEPRLDWQDPALKRWQLIPNTQPTARPRSADDEIDSLIAEQFEQQREDTNVND